MAEDRGGIGGSNDGKDVALELYKLEYEKGAERYQEIYKAVWTNFSYLTVVSGGIYAFGSGLFSWETTALLAVLPLLFWWLAIFEPMTRYGDQVEDELSKVEDSLNKSFPTDHKGRKLQHFTNFAGRRKDEPHGRSLISGRGIKWIFSGFIHFRTRYYVRTGLLLLFVAVILFTFGIISPLSLSKTDTVIIDRPGKLDGKVLGLDIQVLKDEAERNDQVKQNLQKLNDALRAVSDDAVKLKSQ